MRLVDVAILKENAIDVLSIVFIVPCSRMQYCWIDIRQDLFRNGISFGMCVGPVLSNCSGLHGNAG